jgi:rod shape determining protein RodA
MTLGIMPVTGLPLPFVSYGGSAMFANLLAVGLLMNVHRGARDL